MDKNLLFLGGHGAPLFVFQPWFLAFKMAGYRIHTVDNSFFHNNSVSEFGAQFAHISEKVDRFDVIAVSYGGNAAMHGLQLNPAMQAKIGKLITVCSPMLGVPVLTTVAALPGGELLFNEAMKEMTESCAMVQTTRAFVDSHDFDFDLHCFYHERDIVAPPESATLGSKSTNHALAGLGLVPGLMMHQAASIDPRTMFQLLNVLTAA